MQTTTRKPHTPVTASLQRGLFDDDAHGAPIVIQPRLPTGPRRVALTPDVERMLAANCAVCVSVSGGKDSYATAIAVSRHLDAIGHTGPRLLIHADLGRVEWRDSGPACERLALKLGWELVVVHRKAGDLLARWETRWANNVARYEALECVKLILPWSTAAMRFCTSELKTKVICSSIRKRFPNHDILNVVGIRRQESASRSKKPIAQEMDGLAGRNQTGLTWNAIVDWTIEQVFAEIDSEGLTLHEGYVKYKASRISCVFCILSNEHDMRAAASCEDNQPLFRCMVDLEVRSTFAFQGSRWLADIAPHLSSAQDTERVRQAKAAAALRVRAEAQLPKHLLYVRGWPTCVPTPEEAALIADVRRGVSTALGLSAAYLTGAEVRERYAQLIGQRNGAAAGVQVTEDLLLDLLA